MMNKQDVMQARIFCENLKGLMMDVNGGSGYRAYADKVLYDISGLDKVATKIMASKNPYLAANRFINFPVSSGLARIFWDEDCHMALQALNDLVVCAYQAAQISMKPKNKITRDDQRAWSYLRKLYRNGVKAIRENYGYSQSAKRQYKEQFEDLRNYAKGRGGYGNGFLPILDDEDDEDDSDLFETDPNLAIRGIRKVTPRVPADDDALFGLALGDEDDDEDDDDGDYMPPVPRSPATDRILKLQQAMRQNPRYTPEEAARVDYDFTGKATLETIADRMESVLEGIELIVSRLYGREMTDMKGTPSDDSDSDLDLEDGEIGFRVPTRDLLPSEEPERAIDPNQLFQRMLEGDFSMLTTPECIKIYNSLSDQMMAMAQTQVHGDDGHIKPINDPPENADDESTELGTQPSFTIEVGGESPTEDESPTESTAPEDKPTEEPTAADLFNREQGTRQAGQPGEQADGTE